MRVLINCYDVTILKTVYCDDISQRPFQPLYWEVTQLTGIETNILIDDDSSIIHIGLNSPVSPKDNSLSSASGINNNGNNVNKTLFSRFMGQK